MRESVRKRNWQPTAEEETILLLVQYQPSQAHLWSGVAAHVFAWIREGNEPAIRRLRLALNGQDRPAMGAPTKGKMKSALLIYLSYECMKAGMEGWTAKEIWSKLTRLGAKKAISLKDIPKNSQPAARAKLLLKNQLGVGERILNQRLKTGRAEWLLWNQENTVSSVNSNPLSVADLKRFSDKKQEQRQIYDVITQDLNLNAISPMPQQRKPQPSQS
jgi:hypothetical protein